MILGKNTNLQKKYQSNCYSREDFHKILSGAFDTSRVRTFDSTQKEVFTIFDIKDDSIDFTIWNIFYPLPLVKEIQIINWAGGWSHNQSLIHFEYWAEEWKMRRVIKVNGFKEEHITVTKEQIFPEIAQFINNFDSDKAKKLLRNFNLYQLL